MSGILFEAILKVDLYQESSAGGLSRGISGAVSNYINRIQKGAVITDKGNHSGFSRSGGPPFPAKAIQIGHEYRTGSNLSIFLGELKLKDGFYFIRESAAYISVDPFQPGSDIKLIHYFIYLTSVVLLDYHINKLNRHETTGFCPLDQEIHPENLLSMIKRSHLCHICESNINEAKNQGIIDENLVNSVRSVMGALAKKYANHKEKSKQIRTETIPKASLKARKMEKIDSDSEIETATTGEFGLAHDDESPPDALGYKEYADAFATAISSERTETPLTIGICAPWGRGKTVLLTYIREYLLKYNNESKIKCQCIHFRAWEYANSDQIWAEFYTKVLSEIEKRLKNIQKIKFRINFNKKAFPILTILFTFIFLLSIATLLSPIILIHRYPFAYINILEFFGELETFAKTLILGLASIAAITSSIIGLLTSITKKLFLNLKAIFSISYPKARHETIRRLGIISTWLKNHMDNRVVVFIDDIDRCAPDQILKVFEAIRVFLDIDNFVFLVAMDTKVVRFAIAEHYKFMGRSKHEREEIGRYYLEKIVQVPFRLPELKKKQLLNLNSAIMNKHLKVQTIYPETIHIKRSDLESAAKDDEIANGIISNNLKEKATQEFGSTKDESYKEHNALIEPREAEIIRELLNIDGFDLSPRLLKRLINIYMVARHIYILEDQRKTGQDKGQVPDKTFIKWLALSVVLPFETKALIEWWKINNWQDPFGNDKLFLNDRFVLREAGEKENTYPPMPKKDSPFAGLNISNLDKMAKLYSAMLIDHNVVADTIHITGCFNLILD